LPPFSALDQLGVENALIARWGVNDAVYSHHRRPKGTRDMTKGTEEIGVRSGTLSPEGVQRMFDRIAPVYDLMNRVMTVGLDQRWRRKTVKAVVQPGDRVLDAACGTGDLAIIAAKAGGTVTGLDFSERMLERARRKAPEIEWIQGDLLALPFQ
jgi:2-polyprenyl-3-methyl-5-hydroxy-6-metoxy-1,4-benzoquinol methylase